MSEYDKPEKQDRRKFLSTLSFPLAAGALALTMGKPLDSSGISSLNTLTGSLTIIAGSDISVVTSGNDITISSTAINGDTITSPNSTLNIGGTATNTTLDINLAKSNTWTGAQTFANGLTISAGVITFDTVPQASQNGFTSNTGYGTGALINNLGNNNNSAFGLESLYSNTTGGYNSTFGYQSLFSNTTGNNNSAFGLQSLINNTTGNSNSAFGLDSLFSNTTGNSNSAFGYQSLLSFNDTTGANDYIVAIGYSAGNNYTGKERNNIILGANQLGVAGESNVTRIANSSTTNYYLGSSPAARVTGDLYLVFDPITKEIHLSAIGPTS